MKILFTGFAPFDGGKTNPSFDCLMGLPETIAGARIVTARLPVSFRQGPETLAALLERERPDAAVCLGLAAGRKKITPEKVAINFAHAGIPDNDGQQPWDTPLDPRGPAAYFATLPVTALVEDLNRAGLPAALSLSAGAYVCNSVMFHLLAWATPRGVPAGFIHVPSETDLPLPEITCAVTLIAQRLAGGGAL